MSLRRETIQPRADHMIELQSNTPVEPGIFVRTNIMLVISGIEALSSLILRPPQKVLQAQTPKYNMTAYDGIPYK